MLKKKKTLLVIAIVCFFLAAVCFCAAVFFGGAFGAKSSTERFVEKRYLKEYQNISSFGIQAEPDICIKAAYFKLTKDTAPDAVMENFDLMKLYDGFHIYDVGVRQNGSTKNFLLMVYASQSHAVIAATKEYESAADRADILTDLIRTLDNDYSGELTRLGQNKQSQKLY